MKDMSYVVRHKSTGRYLRGRGQWTGDLENALHFNSGLSLVNYIDSGAERDGADRLEIVTMVGSSGVSEENAVRVL